MIHNVRNNISGEFELKPFRSKQNKFNKQPSKSILEIRNFEVHMQRILESNLSF